MTVEFDVRAIFEDPFSPASPVPPDVIISLATESERGAEEHAFARALHGDLKTRSLYPSAADGRSYVIFLSERKPPSLGASKPGAAHRGTALGAALAAALADAPFLGRAQLISVRASTALQRRTDFCKRAFLTAVQHRMHSVRKPKAKPEGAASPGQSRVRIEAEAFFDQALWHEAAALNESMLVCRMLVNLPANLKTPSLYEARVLDLVRAENERAGNAVVGCRIFQASELAERGCGLLLAVGAGSAERPRLIRLHYAGSSLGDTARLNGKQAPKITLVGKGITFDSGGLDIKPSAGMRNMKKDMGGSASALGAFLACARLRLPVDLTCYLSIAENMVSGSSMRPGDVYRAHNGLTVEIDNTDAEGRLVLADALSMAADEEPDWILSLATLTGAARVALGPLVDALFSTDAAALERLSSLAIETGDWAWPMPLVDDYDGMYDSVVADMANSGAGGFAGAITAALFLRRFVGNVPYSHLDTFMWADKPGDLAPEAGGTAKCVRLVVAAIEEMCRNPSHS